VSVQYQSEELDDATREYLRAVHRAGGQRMPGIYIAQPNYLPITGLILGLLVIGLTLGGTLPPVGNPLNEAMLQTAGIMLGGWMILAALRVWMGRASRRYIGHFLYVDPLNVWDAYESWVKVTPLAGLRGARCEHNTSEKGQYKNSTVHVYVAGGEHTFTVENRLRAGEIAAFVNRVNELRNDPGRRSVPTPAVLGALARQAALRGELPREVTANELAVEEVPQPQRARRARLGVVRYALILAVGAGLFFLFRDVNPGLRDDALYEEAVTTGRPALLRGYLLDQRNTRHREAAQAKLSGYYDDVIARLRRQTGGTDLNKGLNAILEGLKSPDVPVVVIAVREAKPDGIPLRGAPDPATADDRAAKVRDDLREQLTRRIGDDLAGKVPPSKWFGEEQTGVPADFSQRVGEELVRFAEAKGDKPAQIEVVYRYVRDPRGEWAVRIDWTVTLRTEPDKPPVATRELTRGPMANPATVDANLSALTEYTVGELASGPANNPAAPAPPGRPPAVRPGGGP
jgi:hypothetical protein